MKDIEKLFEDTLKNHKVVPPAHTWEKLHHHLHGKQRKLKLLYWKIAASVVLVIGAVVAISVFLDGQSVQPSIVVLENTIQDQLPENKTYEEPSNEGNKVEKLENTSSEQQQPIAKAKKESAKQVKKTKLPTVTDSEKKQETEDLSKPAFLATVPTVQPNTVQSLKLSGNVTENHDLTRITLVSLDDKNPPMKVIYKGANPQEKNTSLEKTFAFLDHLKSTNISLSELRQAKDDLITKAFSSKDHEEAGR